MALLGDLEVALGTECVQDESDVSPCEFCHKINLIVEELPFGVAQDCSNCRLLLDAIETWNETENWQLSKHFGRPEADNFDAWYQSCIQLHTEETHPKYFYLKVFSDTSK